MPSATATSDPGQAILTSIVDNSGVTRVKLIPANKVSAVTKRGVGLSPAFATMCVDDAVVHVDDAAPVGDMRLRPDLDAAAELSASLRWAPADQLTQDLEPVPFCQRSAVRRLTEEAERAGYRYLMAYEFEFTLYRSASDGAADRPAHDGPGYGLLPFLQNEDFILDVLRALENAGVEVEIMHPEYGKGQIEISVAPTSPVSAADRAVLVRLVVMRAAARHGCRVSFAPLTAWGGIGNGAHLHFSASTDGGNVFSTGDQHYGMNTAGSQMIAGLHHNLPAATALFAPSVVSFERLAPGMWSGAWACWGLENREAALRFIAGTRGFGDSSANCEVKLLDPAANPYLGVAAVLALSQHGVRAGAQCDPPVASDPASVPQDQRAARGIRELPTSLPAALDALGANAVLRESLGGDLVDLYCAVHRYEHATYGSIPIEERIELLRWRY